MREGWREAEVLAVSYCGAQTAAPSVEPAVRALRIALPRARLVLLWPAPVLVPAALLDVLDERIDYPLVQVPEDAKPDRALRSAAARTVAALHDAAPAGAVVFSECGRAPYFPAYLCCLAGVPKRAGFTAEFGGGVLTQAFAPPAAELPEAERHLHLLELLGLAHRAEISSFEPRVPAGGSAQPSRRTGATGARP